MDEDIFEQCDRELNRFLAKGVIFVVLLPVVYVVALLLSQ